MSHPTQFPYVPLSYYAPLPASTSTLQAGALQDAGATSNISLSVPPLPARIDNATNSFTLDEENELLLDFTPSFSNSDQKVNEFMRQFLPGSNTNESLAPADSDFERRRTNAQSPTVENNSTVNLVDSRSASNALIPSYPRDAFTDEFLSFLSSPESNANPLPAPHGYEKESEAVFAEIEKKLFATFDSEQTSTASTLKWYQFILNNADAFSRQQHNTLNECVRKKIHSIIQSAITNFVAAHNQSPEVKDLCKIFNIDKCSENETYLFRMYLYKHFGNSILKRRTANVHPYPLTGKAHDLQQPSVRYANSFVEWSTKIFKYDFISSDPKQVIVEVKTAEAVESKLKSKIKDAIFSFIGQNKKEPKVNDLQNVLSLENCSASARNSFDKYCIKRFPEFIKVDKKTKKTANPWDTFVQTEFNNQVVTKFNYTSQQNR